VPFYQFEGSNVRQVRVLLMLRFARFRELNP